MCVWLKRPGCFFPSKDGLVVAFGWPDSAVRVDEPLNKVVHLTNIPSGQTPDNSPALAVCIWERVSVCVFAGWRPSHASTAYSISLSFIPSRSPRFISMSIGSA